MLIAESPIISEIQNKCIYIITPERFDCFFYSTCKMADPPGRKKWLRNFFLKSYRVKVKPVLMM